MEADGRGWKLVEHSLSLQLILNILFRIMPGFRSLRLNAEWSCGSVHQFDTVPDECLYQGLAVSLRWEGSTQETENGCQYIHAIAVEVEAKDVDMVACDTSTKPMTIGRIRDGRAIKLSRFLKSGVVEVQKARIFGEFSRIKTGAKQGRFEGFKIKLNVVTSLHESDADFAELELACGPSSAWKKSKRR
jgi:hypothetical protein